MYGELIRYDDSSNCESPIDSMDYWTSTKFMIQYVFHHEYVSSEEMSKSKVKQSIDPKIKQITFYSNETYSSRKNQISQTSCIPHSTE